jgi:hypothetical protein
VLRDQSPENGIEVRAIDKAGNIRLGDFDPGTVPPRQYTMGEYLSLALLLLAALIAIAARLHIARRNAVQV